MIIQEPQVLVPRSQINKEILRRIERYARVCYKSEGNIKKQANQEFLRGIISRGHESVIEHEKLTVLFVVDRGISHELVRHRIASFSQESTRYCNYSNERFGQEITVINPFFYKNAASYDCWRKACEYVEVKYLELISQGSTPQEARSILPNSLKTEIVVTFNLREWRHFFNLRTSSTAHPQMRQVTIPLLLYFKKHLPVFFDDIKYDIAFPEQNYAKIIETDDVLNFLL